MKKLKRLVCLSAAAMLALSMLAGCGSANRSTENTTTAASTDATTTTAPEKSQDKSPVTLSWFINESWYSTKWDETNTLVHKEIFEKTGVNLDIQASAASGEDKLNILIASNNLPDVISLGWWYPQAKQLAENGMVYPLMELVDNYAPSFKSNIPESMVKWYSLPDGKWYMFPNYFMASEHMSESVRPETNAAVVARKDVMDQLGIKAEDFNTPDGFYNALKKVKDANIKYKGVNVLPFYGGSDGGMNDTWDWIMGPSFGVSREAKDGSYIDYRTHPNYLTMMKFANKLYREGLISKDNLTSDRKQIEEKIVNGSIFALAYNFGNMKQRMSDLLNSDKNAMYVPIGPIKPADGSGVHFSTTGMNGWLGSMITKNCKIPDRAIRFFEFLYSQEGQRLTAYGVEGQTYTLDNGRVKYTPEYLKAKTDNSEQAAKKYGVDTIFFLYNYVKEIQPIRPLPETDADKMADAINTHFSQFTYVDRPFDNIDPDANTDESDKESVIKDYWKKQWPKILMAKSEADCEAAYNETIKHMKELGFDSIMKVKNEKFQANKAKLGIKFAWPENK